MAALTKIGLDEAKSEQLADELNNLLATYMIFYQNARGFHWNIKGDKFFELHVKFEEFIAFYIPMKAPGILVKYHISCQQII